MHLEMAQRSPYTDCPPIETVVQVDVMDHMNTGPAKDAMPGGLYAIIVRDAQEDGDLQVVTVPRSLTKSSRYQMWQWEATFPFDMRDEGGNYMRLLRVPDHVTAAVLALADLSDTLPVVVDDGWLC